MRFEMRAIKLNLQDEASILHEVNAANCRSGRPYLEVSPEGALSEAVAMADHLRADLPLAALRMAIPAQRPSVGLIHHSVRGQYASADYRKLTQSAGSGRQ
ncbi:hypothetical protein H8A95_08935 [Bradyrhizobium sp. Pear76]|uniref:hypothetical protein n=1 Tax=Bradyrhizobium oropedii TaxID=1571201 RepID=UPI003B849EAB|nr:hypothetical protein [Bradyrhizobium oropedii]